MFLRRAKFINQLGQKSAFGRFLSCVGIITFYLGLVLEQKLLGWIATRSVKNSAGSLKILRVQNVMSWRSAGSWTRCTQVIKFGLNINPKSYNLTFENITEAQSDTIETFLDARIADGDYFNWQAPDEASTSKYRALDRVKKIDFPNLATIRVTFEEVFEP